ncbi:unnamed protein product, partial [Prorocentrum cordatum]
MLKGLLARWLKQYVKGLSSDQVHTSRLASGKLTLDDVELDLGAVADLLVGALPYTLELRRVYCRRVSLKVPWKSLRRSSVCVDVEGVEVEVAVHDQDDADWLARQTELQHRQLVRGSMLAAEGLLRDEEDEEQKQDGDRRHARDQLRVGLDKVIADGLRATLRGLSVVLAAAAPPRAAEV